MIERIRYYITKNTDPYHNLALEEHLFCMTGDRECILFLWQNEKTVVIGKNQNPWRECRIKELEKDKGRLVRRLSGGGAVFHDLGNLNFTFLAAKENYDVNRQLQVILDAVNRLGIPAEKTGRNDIAVEGKKFSGNAFYCDNNRCFHHGTILVDVDIEKLSHYLNVSINKLQSKGVESVRSRVTNLKEYNSSLTIAGMTEELITSFGKIYGLTPATIRETEINEGEVLRRKEKFASRDWIYGRRIAFDSCLERRFSWGDIEIQFKVDRGSIHSCRVYSDSLETDLFGQVEQALTGCMYREDDIIKALTAVPAIKEQKAMLEDILSLNGRKDFNIFT